MSKARATGGCQPSIIKPSAPEWDAFVRAQPRAHILQLSPWAALKARFGWRSRVVALAAGGRIQAGAQVLLKRLPLGAGWLAYAPMGGYAEAASLYPQLWAAIGKETGAAFLKLEPGHLTNEPSLDLAGMGFRESPQTIQPPRTIMLDIAAEDGQILQRMNQGTRRKIRKSLASKLECGAGSAADLGAFSALMAQTGGRNGFGVHSQDYFEAAFQLFMPHYGALLTARHEGELLAAIMVFALGERAWYLYGASSRAQGKVYASYGIQWAAIQWARARGCRSYDLWGVPDHDLNTLEAQFKQRRDGLWGVYGFKRGWGGVVKRTLGAWDFVYNPLVYHAYRGALRLRD